MKQLQLNLKTEKITIRGLRKSDFYRYKKYVRRIGERRYKYSKSIWKRYDFKIIEDLNPYCSDGTTQELQELFLKK